MRINVNVHPTESTNYGCARVAIICPETGYSGTLDLDYVPLSSLANQSTISLDLLFIASIVYSVDKIVVRKHAIDAWTRQLEVNIPVENLDQWNVVKMELESCLSFLTGDYWKINFSQLQFSLTRPVTTNNPIPFTPEAICLFSGGLDSLIGAINWLEENNEGRLILASHYDARASSPKHDQDSIYTILNRHYQGRLHKIQVRAGQIPAGKETTFRSRSFLFLAIGLYVASSFNSTIPLLLPENATIGLNVPLTPSRRGSCSTRTTHPNFMMQYTNILRVLGLVNPIYNPLDFLTKGECVEQCLNRQMLVETVMHSVSCGKRGHTRSWIRRQANGCGRCMPCIYRRAALNKIGLDTEQYGRDICTTEVSLSQEKGVADDLRACVSFLSKNHNVNDVASILLANGTIEAENLVRYSEVVVRAMDEIRTLIQDKASSELSTRVGL